MPRVLVADPIAEAGIERLRQAAEVDVKTSLTPDELKRIIGSYDALAVRSETKVTADVTLVAFDCPAPIAVELYRVEGGGHSWPGSEFSKAIANVVGPTTTTIDADALMWAFFEQHPRS